MRTFKRFIAVFIIFSVVLSLFVAVSADESKTKTLEDPRGKYLSAYSYDTALEQTLTGAWDNYASKVNILKYKISEEELSVYFYISDLYPEYFYLANNINYDTSSAGYVTYIYITYLYKKEVCDTQRAQLNSAVDNILSKMNGIESDEDKVVFIHDYISTHNEYDPDGVSGDVNAVDDYSFTAYGCLVNGVSVCQGMSDAFVLLCKNLGISAGMASSENMVHVWNFVKLGEEYYHLDITWDDSAEEVGLPFDGDNFLDVKGFVSHQYFIKSDEQMLSLDHYDWDQLYYATDSVAYNNYYWKGVYSHIYYINGYQYYIKNSCLIKRNASTGEEEALYTINDGNYYVSGTKYVWDSENAVLSYNYSDDILFMNLSDGVYTYNLGTSQVKKVIDYGENGYIGGILVDEDILYCDIISLNNGEYYQGDEVQVKLLVRNEGAFIFGDINDSGKCDMSDALEMRRFLVDYGNEINELSADINEDNEVNLLDLLLVRKYLAGYDV